jgi:uracil-DNA glycosylase family 4
MEEKKIEQRGFEQSLWEALGGVEDYLAQGGYSRDWGQAPAMVEDEPLESGPVSQDFASLMEKVCLSRPCEDSAHRIQGIPGIGSLSPRVLILAPNPEPEEAEAGKPLNQVQRTYLEKWLEPIGINMMKDAYLINLFICPKPGKHDEALLIEFVDFLSPKVIFCLGGGPAGALIGSPISIRTLRGQDYSFHGYPLVPTYHPAAVLEDQSLKRPVWDDLKRLKGILEYDG